MTAHADDTGQRVIILTRDSVCMADDVESPHERAFTVPAGASLDDIAKVVAASDYLPMPSDAWGWTIGVPGAVMAIRPRPLFGRWTERLDGDPTAALPAELTSLDASYVRPDSTWRQTGRPVRRIGVGTLYLVASAVLLIAFAWWRSSG